MPSRDSNDATWYVLRHAEHFAPRPGSPPDPESPFSDPSSPFLEPSLLYDEARGVLELQPEASPFAADPPPGLAVEPGGDLYRVDEDGRLVVVRCDGSERLLFCEAGILARPAGLALDRRGYLYVADPAARRVVVVDPEASSVRAVLVGGGPIDLLEAPVDVVVSASGLVLVADRDAGRVAVFSAGFKPLTSFTLAAAPGRSSRPIALWLDDGGNLLVADAWLPRLLRYTTNGTRLGDVDLGTLAAPLAGGAVALGAWRRAYGDRLPRFLVGRCGPCATPEDGAARLVEVHRAVRVLALVLGRRFRPEGTFVSRALDGGRPGVSWHRVEIEWNGEPPPDTSVVVETFTSDTPTPGAPTWTAPTSAAGVPIPFASDPGEQLVQSPPGRFLWLRVVLRSADGSGTPSIRALRVWYPRVGWLDLLPTAYRRDPEAARFLDRFLALAERVFTRVEDRYEEFSRELNPDAAPPEVAEWLGALIDLAFDPSWPLARRRALLSEAMSLYRTRGTVAGLERYVEIYTGRRPRIVEGWLERPARPAYLGRPGAILGCGLPLLGSHPSAAVLPDDLLWARHAHRFDIFVYVDDPCLAEVTLRVVDRIVEANKPAHTIHRCRPVYPGARVGVQSRVGLDLVLGAAGGGATRLGGCEAAEAAPGTAPGPGEEPPSSPPPGVLGVDTVLGARRPEYVRRRDPQS
jgi:phage tail-like protein